MRLLVRADTREKAISSRVCMSISRAPNGTIIVPLFRAACLYHALIDVPWAWRCEQEKRTHERPGYT